MSVMIEWFPLVGILIVAFTGFVCISTARDAGYQKGFDDGVLAEMGARAEEAGES